MGTNIGIRAAMLAPLLLLAGAGAVRVAHRPDPLPPPLRQEVRRDDRSAASARPPKPYPFKDLSAGHPEAAVRTWSVLASTSVTLDVEDESIPNILEFLSSLTGLVVVPAQGLEGDPISFKVTDIIPDHALRLLLRTRKMDYEILEDGTIRVDAEDRIRGGYEKIGQRAMLSLQELDQIRKHLNLGWDGLALIDFGAAMEQLIRTKRIVTIEGETSLTQEIHRLSELGVNVQILRRDELDIESILSETFFQTAAERLLEDHLQNLAGRQGMVAFPYYASVVFAKAEHAVVCREEVEKPRQEHRRLLEILQIPVERSGTSDIPGFLDSIGRSHGLEVVPTEAAWNCPATLSIPAGTTLKQALDKLRRHGLRWAAHDGKLYVLK